MGEVYLKLNFIDSQSINFIAYGLSKPLTKSQLQLSIDKVIIDENEYNLININDKEYRIEFLNYDFVKYKVWIDIDIKNDLGDKSLSSLRVNAGAYIFENESIDSSYCIPNVSSGTYIFSLDKVNGEKFDTVNTNVIVCNGIDSEKSKIYTQNSRVNPKDKIEIFATVYDSEGNKVPDGTYIIYLSQKQI